VLNNKKVLLVLGGFAQVCDIVEDAVRSGIYVIVTDYLEDSPAKRLADESHMLSITDVDGIVELCRTRNVDGVMNYCIDPGQKPYQQICERLELPCYGTQEQFQVMTNKDLFKKACSQNGVDTIPEYSTDSTLECVGNITFPIVIKPADSRASKGSTICVDPTEIPQAIAKAFSNSERKRILIEKFISGQEVVIKYFVADGVISLTSMADLYTCYTADGKRAYIGAQVFPSKYYQLYRDTADSNVRRMIRQLGIQNGPMSFDGFVDGDKFRFFDPSFRLGGAQDWRIVAAITGVNISRLLTTFALTGSMGDSRIVRNIDGAFAHKSAAMLYFLVREGKIKKIHGLSEALSLGSVVGHHLSHVEGDVVRQFGTSDHVVMRILLVCDDNVQLRNNLKAIQNVIAIVDDTGDNMLLPNFDADLI
jgi:biotin carboxylase